MSEAKQMIIGGVPIILKDNTARMSIGDLSDLLTTEKDNLVAAINEIALAGVQDYDVEIVTTLPTASESTMGNIYFVGPDSSDNYNRYITKESEGTYSWLPLGSTQIDLSDYATKEEVAQLEHLIVGGTVTEKISTSGYSPIGYFITNTNVWYNQTGNPTDSIAIPLDGIDNIKVTMSGGGGYIAFLKSLNHLTVNGNPDFATGYSGRIQFADGDVNTYNIPSDANYLYIQSVNATGVDMLPRYNITTEVPSSGAVFREDIVDNLLSDSATVPLSAKQGSVLKGMIDNAAVRGEITISPEVEIGNLNNNGLESTTVFYGKKYWRTSRFIKLSGSDAISASVVTTGTSLRFCYYDANFTLLAYHDVAVSSTITDTPVSGAEYLRVGIDSARPSTSAFDIPKPKLTLSGKFSDNWDVFLNRPASGSLSILVPVMVSDPNTTSAEAIAVQDTQTLLSDTGILALPETYDPTGDPTRLIIFCHGAGRNYPIGTSSFDPASLRPDFWLSEGYAVMDVEGNPYNDSDEHCYNPTARQSYIAAYEFVTKKYNIRRDGILLGGSSMGGGMCFDLLLSDIPIIAACPLVPAVNTMWWWEYMNATRRQFTSQKMGFVGTAPTFTSNHPMSAAEWQYLQDNYDKFIKYSPFFALMPDTPSKTEIFSIGNISNADDSETEDALYATRHFKCKAPVKMFAVHDDTTVNNHRNCDLVYSMMVRSAQIVELRYFPTGGHAFYLTDPYILSSYTNSYGEVLSGVPLVYVEMLAFWRRYEQGL